MHACCGVAPCAGNAENNLLVATVCPLIISSFFAHHATFLRFAEFTAFTGGKCRISDGYKEDWRQYIHAYTIDGGFKHFYGNVHP